MDGEFGEAGTDVRQWLVYLSSVWASSLARDYHRVFVANKRSKIEEVIVSYHNYLAYGVSRGRYGRQ